MIQHDTLRQFYSAKLFALFRRHRSPSIFCTAARSTTLRHPSSPSMDVHIIVILCTIIKRLISILLLSKRNTSRGVKRTSMSLKNQFRLLVFHGKFLGFSLSLSMCCFARSEKLSHKNKIFFAFGGTRRGEFFSPRKFINSSNDLWECL